MEQLSPIPLKAMMKARRRKNDQFNFGIIELGVGWSSCFIYFVQDCSLKVAAYESLDHIGPNFCLISMW